MSYSIYRMQKIKGNFITGIQIHNQREKSLANQDIVKAKSHLNYDLHNDMPVDYNQRFNEIIAEAGITKYRSDAIRGIDILTTSDNDFFKSLTKSEQEKYFEDNYNFICAKYGQDKVIASVVHLDETTPHMHTTIVPITEDGRLSAKDLMRNPAMLKELQTEYNHYINDQGFQLDRGITSERKHIELEKFKVLTKEQELEKELLSKEQSIAAKTKNLDEKFSKKASELNKENQLMINKIETLDVDYQERWNRYEGSFAEASEYLESQENYKIEFLKKNENLQEKIKVQYELYEILEKQILEKKALVDNLKLISSNILIKSKELNNIENKALQAKKALENLDNEIEQKKQSIPKLESVAINVDGVKAQYEFKSRTLGGGYVITEENLNKLSKTIADTKTASINSQKFENLAKSELESAKIEFKKEIKEKTYVIAEKNQKIHVLESNINQSQVALSKQIEAVKEFVSENKLCKEFEQFPAKQLAKQIEKEFIIVGKITKEYKEHTLCKDLWDRNDSKWKKYYDLKEERKEQYERINALIENAKKDKHFAEVSKNHNGLDSRIYKHGIMQESLSRSMGRGGIVD